MSEPMPEGGAPGGGFMSKRFLGIPAVVWLIAAALLAYLYFRNQNSSSSGSSGGASSASTGNTPTTGNISVKPAETIDVSGLTQSQSDQQTTEPAGPTETGRDNDRQHQTKTSNTKYTVKAGESLTEIAKRFGISVACLAHHNVYVKGEVPGNKKVGQRLGTGAGLKTGQVLTIPSKDECSGS